MGNCNLTPNGITNGKVAFTKSTENKDGYDIALSGKVYGKLGEGCSLDLTNNANDITIDMIFDNLSLTMTQITYNVTKPIAMGNLYFGNKTGIVDYSKNVVSTMDDSMPGHIKSLNGIIGLSLSIVLKNVSPPLISSYAKVVDKNGVINNEFAISLVAFTGIKDVKTTDGRQVLFANPYDEEFVDLTKVEVTCEEGYKFVGWYYVDADGKTTEITNPEKFIATDFTMIFAVGEPESEPRSDPDPPEPESESHNDTWLVIIMTVMTTMIAAAFVFWFVGKE